MLYGSGTDPYDAAWPGTYKYCPFASFIKLKRKTVKAAIASTIITFSHVSLSVSFFFTGSPY